MAATDPKDTVYNSRQLSKWFAIGSFLLLLAMVWAVLEDHDRQWKVYQRQAKNIAAAVGEARLKRAEGALDQSKLDALERQISDLTKESAELVSEMDGKIKKTEDVYFKANQIFQFEKAALDAMLYQIEHAIHEHKPKAAELRPQYEKLSLKVNALKAKADEADRARAEAQELRKDILVKVRAAEDELAALTKEKNFQLKSIALNEPSLGSALQNAPLLNFVAPTLKISQVVLPHLKDDYFFNKVPRVDRCMTCHVTIDKTGFEDYPQPFKSHPKLELYAAPNSPHPMEKVGCTVCHAGIPQSVDFTLAGHTPRDYKQEAEWAKRYGYKRDPFLGTPMIPTPMTEGKCVQCHSKQIELAGAPTFNAGMRLIERYGCYTCHKFNEHFTKLAQERKPAPSLNRVAGKLTAEWVEKWLWDPQSFRPSTLMPRYWKNHNNSDPASLVRSAVEIESITHFLFKKSESYQPLQLASGVTGDLERGKALVGKVGCLACHAVADFPRKNVEDPKALGHKDPRIPMFGPELNQLGSKVTKEWLTTWLIDPKHYWESTSMPSLKLSEQEASDIASYLLSKRNPEFEQATVPKTDDRVRDSITLNYLETVMPPQEAKTKLASMSLDDKKSFLGEKFVNHYGCYGCHAISGFETAPLIGAELSYEGSKAVSKFAFENVEIPHHSRVEWILTKIRTPRIWDVGKVRDFAGKTRMPQFNFNHEQAQAIASIVIGQENDNNDDEAEFKVDGRWEKIIAGQRVIQQKNCVGCHAIEKAHGEILAHYPDDATMGPPQLGTQGEKTQASWLHAYLQNPVVKIRPWLEVRMPQFSLSTEHTSNLTEYFAAYDKAPYPFVGPHSKKLSPEEYAQASALVGKLACLSCHGVRKPGEDVSAAAPHFADIKARLNGAWIPKWLHNPQAIMPGTRMPTLWPSLDEDDPKAKLMAIPGYFGDDADRQIEAVRDYLFMNTDPATIPPPRVDPPRAQPAPKATQAQAGG